MKYTSIFFFTLTVTIFLCSAVTYGQQERDKLLAKEYTEQQEQLKKTQVLREMDSAIYLMEKSEYNKADEKFRYVLSNIKSVPSDLTFHFGKNSFYLGKFQQSIDWLTKYIQLKGTNGQFSDEALNLKKKAEAEFLKTRADDSKKVSEVLSNDYSIDCGPDGKVFCPVCKGEHVIIKRGLFGSNEYKTCPYCNEHGVLSCEEYNLLLRGELNPRNK